MYPSQVLGYGDAQGILFNGNCLILEKILAALHRNDAPHPVYAQGTLVVGNNWDSVRDG